MRELLFKDCYARLDGALLRIGNRLVEKRISLAGNRPMTVGDGQADGEDRLCARLAQPYTFVFLRYAVSD